MTPRRLTPWTSSVVAIAVVALAAVALVGQAPTPGTPKELQTWTAPRTAWGDPDLQGIWNVVTPTPLERPSDVKTTVQTEEQAAAQLAKNLSDFEENRKGGGVGKPGGYSNEWKDAHLMKPSARTSLIVDPPDGRIPPLTPAGQQRASRQVPHSGPRNTGIPEISASWEDRGLWERCLVSGRSLPINPGSYLNNYEIFQTPGYVVMHAEILHDARIIPVDGRPHLGQGIRQWGGDSIGHWEGQTLVVETTNFSDKTVVFRGSGENLRLIERFTRVDADTLEYQYTVDDPTTFTRPWTAIIPATKFDEGPLYEYACHEGNYGMVEILTAARAREKAAESGEEGTQ